MMDSAILCCRNVSKYFTKVRALEDVNLEIRQGEIFGLLGPNGAGKTTLLRCILKLIDHREGKILFRDKPLLSDDIQRYFGFLPEDFSPYGNLSGRELLSILGWGLNLKSSKVESLLRQVGLNDKKDKRIRSYSRGMVQRLGLAMALLKEPEVIILDEPTLGLDPLGQREMLGFLKDLNQEGKTIFFSSHILSQVEKVCHRIGIIHQGRLIFIGSIEEILEKHSSSSLEEAFLKEISR